MAVTSDIAATYRRGPAAVVRRLLDMGPNEGRALAILIAACLVVFVSQWPPLARQAHFEGRDVQPLLGGALMAWLFVAPLLLYGLAALSHLVARALGGRGGWFGARLALFWALMASSPLILLHGLVKGFVGEGPGLQIVGLLWFLAFTWFWIAGLREAEKGPA